MKRRWWIVAIAFAIAAFVLWPRNESRPSRPASSPHSHALRLAAPKPTTSRVRSSPRGTCRIAGRAILSGTPVVARVSLSVPAIGELQTTTSDESGVFAFDDLPRRAYTLTVAAAGTAPVVRTVTCSEEVSIISLSPCTRLREGHVRDAIGTPIAGAVLELAGLEVAGADETGAFAVCPDDNGWGSVLVARAPGYAPSARAVGRVGDLELVLVPGASLRVTVTDEAGVPVEGARVFARPVARPFSHVGDAPRSHFPTTAAITNADGVVELEDRPTAPHELTADVGDKLSAPTTLDLLAGHASAITLVVREGALVHGTVTHEGKPVAGVVVGWKTGDPMTTTDASGAFELRRTAGEVGSIALASPWFTTDDVSVVAGSTGPLAIHAYRAPLLRGVVRERGSPVAGAAVMTEYDRVVTSTRADGTFELVAPNHALDGPLSIEARSETASGTLVLPDYRPLGDLTSLVIDLVDTATIRGVVVDTAGAPVVGASVFINGPTTTNARGEFAFARLQPRTYNYISVEMNGWRLTHPPIESIALAAGQVVDLRIVVEMVHGKVTGVVVDDAHHPVPDAYVRTEPGFGEVRTSDDGRFSIPTFSREVAVIAEGDIGTRTTLVAHPDEEVRIVLVRPGALRIRCEGNPHGIHVVPEGLGDGRPARCDELIASVVPGTYNVRAFRRTIDVQVKPGETSEVTLDEVPSTALRLTLTLRGAPVPDNVMITCETTNRQRWVWVTNFWWIWTDRVEYLDRESTEVTCFDEHETLRGSARLVDPGATSTLSIDLQP